MILDPAVRDGKLMQDLELESLCNGVGHSQRVLDHPIANDSGSRSCINLPSPTAGFRMIRLLWKLHLIAKLMLFGIFAAKFFNQVYHAFKILQQICTKIPNFINQSEFRKKFIKNFFFFAIFFSKFYLLIGDEITVDLNNPTYSNNTLTTTSGGIITGPQFRLQAMSITIETDGQEISQVIAEENLIFEWDSHLFIGRKLYFNPKDKTAIIEEGKTMMEPWFFSGSKITVLSTGNYIIENPIVTTSENTDPEWQVFAENATLDKDLNLSTENVKCKFLKLPSIPLPNFNANLNTIFDGPIRYSIRWGGNQGHRLGMVYEAISWAQFKAFLRLDYRINRGIGGGVETLYLAEDLKTKFKSINYAARDSSIIHPNQRFRYRFQGALESQLVSDTVQVHLAYDKLSDIDMASDYADSGLQSEIAGRTEFTVRRQSEKWIANMFTRVRLNQFQTVKQELPTFEISSLPITLGKTGIIASGILKAAYLDFSYGNNMLNTHNYASTRFEIAPSVYKSIPFKYFTMTPEVSAHCIAYGNSPSGSSKYLALAKFTLNTENSFSRDFGWFRHVISPYVRYNYYTMPTVSPKDHYIFDIDDGWTRLNMMTFGCRQSFYDNNNSYVKRAIVADIFANAFFNTTTFASIIPKVYGELVFNSLSTLKHTVNTAWDFDHNIVDHYNIRTELTISSDAALSFEYRYRSPFDFRKVDRTNYILDAYRDQKTLAASQLSDRRDTFLFHAFYRFDPRFALEFESHTGWGRRFEPNYNEFEINLLGNLPCACKVRLSYQHKEHDDRVSAYLSMAINPPPCRYRESAEPFKPRF